MYDEQDRPLSKRDGKALEHAVKSHLEWSMEEMRQEMVRYRQAITKSSWAIDRGNIAVYLCLALLIYIAFKV